MPTVLQNRHPETWDERSVPRVVLDAAVELLAADDERGGRVGLVVQGDGVSWDAVDGLLDLAVYGRLAHRLQEHNGSAGQGCQVCGAADRVWSGRLVDPVTARRGTTATVLHDEIRQQVLADLGATSG